MKYFKKMDSLPKRTKRALRNNSRANATRIVPGTSELEQHEDRTSESIVVRRAMGIRLISDEIFSYLPKKEVLETCSLVSRQWNVQAREFLRLKKRCLLRIDFQQHSYPDLEALTKLLEISSCLPYYGMTVSCARFPSKLKIPGGRSSCWKRFEEAVVNFFDLKAIEIDYGSGGDTQTAMGVEGVVKRVSNRLERLRLMGSGPLTLTSPSDPIGNLGNLKSAWIEKIANTHVELDLIPRIIQCSPKMVNFHVVADLDWIQEEFCSRIEFKSKLKAFATHFDANQMMNPVFVKSCEDFIEEGLQLEEVRLIYNDNSSFCPSSSKWKPEAVARVLDLEHCLLKSSWSTLRELEITLTDFLLLHEFNRFPACPCLEELCFFLRLEQDYNVQDVINLALYFPKLKTIWFSLGKRICRSPVVIPRLGILRSMHPVHSVRSVNLVQPRGSQVEDYQATYIMFLLKASFPEVRDFRTHGFSPAVNEHLLINAFQAGWQHLETISFSGMKLSRFRSSLDSSILGISNRYACHLQAKYASCNNINENDLRHQPPILQMRSLKKLCIEVAHDAPSREKIGEFAISQVSAILALSKMPAAFSIEVYRVGVYNVKPKYQFDLSHLKPLVNVKCSNAVLRWEGESRNTWLFNS